MSRERLALVDRLLRLRKLDEDREAAQLRGHVTAHSAACQRSDEAQQTLELIGLRKARSDDSRGLDLDGYVAALQFEQVAMVEREAAADEQRLARDALQAANERHGLAAAATRVSGARHDRLTEQVRRDDEIKDADRLADLRLGTLRSES
jgi:hypothetical protein